MDVLHLGQSWWFMCSPMEYTSVVTTIQQPLQDMGAGGACPSDDQRAFHIYPRPVLTVLPGKNNSYG
ncbi:MAG TPA: hypothetical protein DCF62_00440, partial [Porticoccaceae bacterium]|nr:hypothetical protein [Porticoccaceae bacterium]